MVFKVYQVYQFIFVFYVVWGFLTICEHVSQPRLGAKSIKFHAFRTPIVDRELILLSRGWIHFILFLFLFLYVYFLLLLDKRGKFWCLNYKKKAQLGQEACRRPAGEAVSKIHNLLNFLIYLLKNKLILTVDSSVCKYSKNC